MCIIAIYSIAHSSAYFYALLPCVPLVSFHVRSEGAGVVSVLYAHADDVKSTKIEKSRWKN